jgi:hypothetical protein
MNICEAVASHPSAVIDILEHQHAPELPLGIAGKTAALRESFGVLVGAEEPVPDRQVGKVVLMDGDLVMD